MSNNLRGFLLRNRNMWGINPMKEKMIMNKWKYAAGSAVVAAAAFAVPVKAANTIVFRLVPLANGATGSATSAGDTITGNPVNTATGGFTVNLASGSDSVTFSIVADVENDDANTANDFFTFLQGEVTSKITAGPLQGTYASTGATEGSPATAGNVTYNSTNLNATTSHPGFESDGEDSSSNPPAASAITNSIGGSVTTSNVGGPFAQGGNGWINLSAPSTGVSGSNSVLIGSTNYSEFNLGTFTWVGNGSSAGTDTLAIAPTARTSGTNAAKQVIKYFSDGTQEFIQFNNALATFGQAQVTIANTPEPASLGLLGLGMTALGIRARRKARKA